MPLSTITALSSSSGGRSNSDGLPFNRSSSDFEIERLPSKSAALGRSLVLRRGQEEYDNEVALQTSVAQLVAAKSRPYTVSGHIPIDPNTLTLFFRSKSGVTHSLDFPIDVEFETPPALDVLIAACRPHPSTGSDEFDDRESLYYPPTLPLSTTLEIANHPILDAVRTVLFPALPTGHHLTTLRDKLEIVAGGGRMGWQPPAAHHEGRVATVIVTLPVRYRGGALVIRDAEGNQEKFYGRGGKSGDMEWTAFLADCQHEVETVRNGCRVTISYGVYLKTFGPSGVSPNPLIIPSDYFLDTLSPILNISRGRRIAFYLTGDYGVSPADLVADALVPYLKGGDSLLYHAIKLYKLAPELRWTAGGFIWPVDATVTCGSIDPPMGTLNGMRSYPASPAGRNGRGKFPAIQGVFNAYGSDSEDDDVDTLRTRVQESGAVPISDLDLFILTDKHVQGPITKERVPLVSGGALEKLVVNVLAVVYVP